MKAGHGMRFHWLQARCSKIKFMSYDGRYNSILCKNKWFIKRNNEVKCLYYTEMSFMSKNVTIRCIIK